MGKKFKGHESYKIVFFRKNKREEVFFVSNPIVIIITKSRPFGIPLLNFSTSAVYVMPVSHSDYFVFFFLFEKRPRERERE